MDDDQQYWCLLTSVMATFGSAMIYIYCNYNDITFLEFVTGDFNFPQIGDPPENPLNEYRNYTKHIPKNNDSIPLGDGIQEPLASFFGLD